MKNSALIVCLAAAMTAQAQTAQKPATSAAKASTAHPAAAHTSAAGAASSAVKLPPGVPKVVGPVTTAFSLRTQEIKAGAGPAAEPFKIYKVLYTGYRAADGVKFDSSDDHRPPVMGADGKPEMGPDGKPKLGEAQPLAFQQGAGRLIPGFDQGVTGMHIGGKRRLFIPYQLAYGTRAMPDQPGHPGIPAKSDLIFDIELVDVAEPPPAPGHPAPASMPVHPAAPSGQPNPAASTTPPPSSQPAQTAPQPKQ
jgi:peptidylprolyl isomerase